MALKTIYIVRHMEMKKNGASISLLIMIITETTGMISDLGPITTLP
jgi:hypothetical protein